MLYNTNSNKWGRVYWEMSHHLTFAYPHNPTNEDKIIVKTHFDNLKYLLLCEKCRLHYSQYLQLHPLTDEILSSRTKLIEWLIDFHNDVNKRLGKRIYSKDEVIKIYTNDNNDNINNINYNFSQSIMMMIIIIVIIMLILKTKFIN